MSILDKILGNTTPKPDVKPAVEILPDPKVMTEFKNNVKGAFSGQQIEEDKKATKEFNELEEKGSEQLKRELERDIENQTN